MGVFFRFLLSNRSDVYSQNTDLRIMRRRCVHIGIGTKSLELSGYLQDYGDVEIYDFNICLVFSS